MDRSTFWQIIDDARGSAGSIDEIAGAVSERLAASAPDEIIAFDQHRLDLMRDAYRWDLWAVAYIVNGGCSDDGFDYFCAWLLAQGRERWDQAMASPESIGAWLEPGLDEAEAEELLYAAGTAYEERTGSDLPVGRLNYSRPSEPVGSSWTDEDLPTLYPELCRTFL